MSSFTTPAILKLLDKRKFEVYEEYIYHIGSKDNNEFIKVPKGFVTDLASIPRIFWSIMPPHDTYAKSAILHDFMYTNGYDKKYSDDTFRESLKVIGVGKFKRLILYYSVKFFGHPKVK